jgi:hypothetical protein
MNAQELINLLAEIYTNRPDGDKISIGHWTTHKDEELPYFYADIGITVAELKEMAKK